MIRPTPPEKLEAVQAGLRSQFEARATEPEVKNDRVVSGLVLGDTFEFPAESGRFFHVPPVHYLKGARLEKLALSIQKNRREKVKTEELVDARTAMQKQALAELARVVRPVGWARRIAWPLTSRLRNPFRHCTDQEVAQLLLFFFSLTTRSRVRFSRESQGT